MFHVLILGSRIQSEKILFEGQSRSVVLPGVEGEFEILDFHKPIISRLKKGVILVDNKQEIAIRGGVVKSSLQKLVAIVDT